MQPVKLPQTILFLLLLVNGNLSSLFAQPINPRFDRISIEDGLSQININCIIQDQNGYLWIGTDDGLNRYDGYQFDVYQHQPHNPKSLPGNSVTFLIEDNQGKIWFSTFSDIGFFDTKKQTFQTIPIIAEDSLSSEENIVSLVKGKQNTIWFSKGDKLYSVDSELLDVQLKWSFSDYSTSTDVINSFVLDTHIWFGTDDGLFLVNATTQVPQKKSNGRTYYIYQASNGDIYALKDDGIYVFKSNGELISHLKKEFLFPRLSHGLMTEDANGNFWIYSRSGLLFLESSSGDLTIYEHDPNDESSLSSNFISSILIDKYGILWVGNTFRGLNKLNLSPGIIEFYNKESGSTLSLSHSDVFSFAEDKNKNIWIGSRRGLNKLDRKRGRVDQYLLDYTILAMVEEDDQNIWIGTLEGIFNINPINGQSTQYLMSDWPVSNEVFALSKGENSELWIGTTGGLFIFDTKTRAPITSPLEVIAPEILNTDVSAIAIQQNNTVWIGTTEEGIYHYDRTKESVKHYSFEENNRNSLSSNSVFGIHQENDSIVWIATYGGGLNRLNFKTNQFTVFTSSNSNLKTNNLDALQVDKNGILWIGTDNGLLRFDPKTYKNQLFGPKDGLQGKEFHQKSAGITRDGELLFGGVNGANIFKPTVLSNINQIAPDIHITSVRSHGKSGDDSGAYYPRDIAPSSQLPYDRNDLEFHFVSLHYQYPSGNVNQVMLEPYETDWKDVGAQRQISYTNLDPGSYTFKVKSANSDGIWNQSPATFSFVIKKPWWQTYWFYALVLSLLILAIYSLRRYELRRLRLATALDIEKIEAERLKQLDKTKSDFFANISHEFRTPLTVILGEIENILEKADSQFRRGLKVSQSNAQKLLALVNQLLDLSKLEAGKITPDKEEIDLNLFMKNQLQSLESLAIAKNIELIWETQLDRCLVDFDANMLGKITNNLLSNAIKFTPKDGKVKLSIQKTIKEDEVSVNIEDTGPGIPEEHKEKIFDRFYQVNSGTSRSHEGTGIGLALTKELVQLHGGEISVHSNGASGSIFTLSLKCKSESNGLHIEETISAHSNNKEKSLPDFQSIELNGEKPIILLVEDNEDVRSYLKSCLIDSYQIIESENGKLGLDKAVEIIPDLIVTDVMMPEMDGLTFSSRIKGDQKTSHIPVIILTARSGEEEKIEGLNKGVDDFLTKPFNKRELTVRIENLLNSRRLLKQKFQDGISAISGSDEISSIDQKFLNTVYSYIDAHVADDQLGVGSIAEIVHMSESQLNRKLKALVGHPPGVIIRSKRLKLAAKLLEKNAGTVSQIALQVGFTDLAAFTRSFKNKYGTPPSKYQDRSKTI